MRRLQVLVLVALCGLACGRGPEPQESVDFQALFRSWVQSSEEGEPASGVQIYKPGMPADLPPSRFRRRYVFYPDGRCEWAVLDAADAHTMQSGRWSRAGADTNIVQLQDATGRQVVSFRILTLTPEVLRIAPMEP